MCDRVAGFQEYMRESGAYLNHIIAAAPRQEDADKQLRSLLSSDPAIHALCLLSSYQKISSVTQAIQQENRSISLICFDRTEEHERCLQNGEISFLITQSPFEQGYQPIKMLFDYLYFHAAPEKKVQYTKTEILTGEMLRQRTECTEVHTRRTD